MKRNFLAGFFLLASIVLSVTIFAQRIYIGVRPAAPVIIRPAAPTPDHSWVDHEWILKKETYVYVPGYWAIPPRRRARWIHGYWKKHHGRGFYWIPGHWS